MNLTSKIRILMGVCPASCWTCIKFEFQFCYCERNLCVLLIPCKILSTVWIFVESVFIIPQVRPTLKPIQKPPNQWVWDFFPSSSKGQRDLLCSYQCTNNTISDKRRQMHSYFTKSPLF